MTPPACSARLPSRAALDAAHSRDSSKAPAQAPEPVATCQPPSVGSPDGWSSQSPLLPRRVWGSPNLHGPVKPTIPAFEGHRNVGPAWEPANHKHAAESVALSASHSFDSHTRLASVGAGCSLGTSVPFQSHQAGQRWRSSVSGRTGWAARR
jgi:hypothetical protein